MIQVADNAMTAVGVSTRTPLDCHSTAIADSYRYRVLQPVCITLDKIFQKPEEIEGPETRLAFRIDEEH